MSSSGYYICDGKRFDSKIRACIYSTEFKKPIQWMFHQDIFSTYPWWIEPQETLDELYDKRARELREKYDYIMLSYSGGADSHNMLQSFIRQGLHVDEIITNHVTDATKSVTVLNANNRDSTNFAAEHQLHTIPRLKELHNKLPRTKITVLDVSDKIFNALKKEDDANWILSKTDSLAIGQTFRYDYFDFIDINKTLDKNKTYAFISGVDKPKSYISHDKFYLYLNDTTANITPIYDYNKYPNLHVEFFYWDRTTAKLICKQGHIIKKWIEYVPSLQKLWRSADYKKSRLIVEPLLRDIIYTTWNKEWYQADKSTGQFHNNQFENWFFNEKKDTREYFIWNRGIEYLIANAKDYIQYNELGMPDGLTQFKQTYCLGEMKRFMI